MSQRRAEGALTVKRCVHEMIAIEGVRSYLSPSRPIIEVLRVSVTGLINRIDRILALLLGFKVSLFAAGRHDVSAPTF